MIVKFLFLLDFFGRGLYNVTRAKYPARVATVTTVQFEVWLSLVERYVRDVEVVGSNPVTSIQGFQGFQGSGTLDFLPEFYFCSTFSVLFS